MRSTIRKGIKKATVRNSAGTAMTAFFPVIQRRVTKLRSVFSMDFMMASAGQHDDVGAIPPDPHALFALQARGVVAGRVGTRDFHQRAAVEAHMVAGFIAKIRHGDDHALGAVVAVFGRRRPFFQSRWRDLDADFLGAHGHRDIHAQVTRDAVRDVMLAIGRGDHHVIGIIFRDAPVEQVHAADEVGDEAAIWRLVDFARRAHLQDAPFAHDGDARGHAHGLVLVVRDHHAGDAHLLDDVDQLHLRALRSFLSSAPSGSSSSSNCGRLARLRASATRCCCPPDNWCGLRLAYWPSCTSASICSTRAATSAFGKPSRRRPKAMLSHTDRCGNSAYDWNIMLMGRWCGGTSTMLLPASAILPEVGVSKPASMRSRVDLPQPELPSSAKISPWLIVTEIPSTARTPSNSLTS